MTKLYSLLLTLFIFILLFSCKKDANSILGDDLNSGRNIGTYYTDTVFHITAFTIPDDSLYIENYTSFLLGTVKDSVFGTTTYNFVSRLLFNNTRSYIQIEGETVEHIDSAILMIPYSGLYPLAENSDFLKGRSFTLSVYELDEDIRTSTELDSAYNIHSEVAYKSPLLNIQTDITLHPPLSTDTTAAQNLQIHLENSAAMKIAAALEEVGLDNSDEFPTKFKGLYFVITPAASEGKSIVASFSADATSGTQITIYFNGNGEEKAPSYYNFSLGTHFMQIKKDRSGSKVESALWDSVKGQDRLYMESIGGSRIRLKIPNLRFLTDTVLNPSAARKPLVINRATLIFKVEDTLSSGVKPPSNVYLYKYINSTLVESIIDNGYNSGGVYDAEKGEYKIYITRWMQNLLYHNDLEIPYLDLSSIMDIRYFMPSQAILYGADSVRLEVIYSLVE